MKKVFAILLCVLLLTSLAACGKTDPGNQGETAADPETAAPVQETETNPEDAGETQETEAPDDETVVKELEALLLGDWNATDLPQDVLTFRADGTGVYESMLKNEPISFRYTVSVQHMTYANGEPYTDNILTVDYNSGESEDIIFFHPYDDTDKIAFHNAENGSYTGGLTFPEWKKA